MAHKESAQTETVRLPRRRFMRGAATVAAAALLPPSLLARGNVITLVHTVTGATAIRSLLPFLSPTTTRRALRYGWQVAAALYSISGNASANRLPEAEEIKPDDLNERAAASQDEHAIKFTEACLREYKLNPKAVYLHAARDAVGRL